MINAMTREFRHVFASRYALAGRPDGTVVR